MLRVGMENPGKITLMNIFIMALFMAFSLVISNFQNENNMHLKLNSIISNS